MIDSETGKWVDGRGKRPRPSEARALELGYAGVEEAVTVLRGQGLSQAEIGEMIGLSFQRVGAIERAAGLPPRDRGESQRRAAEQRSPERARPEWWRTCWRSGRKA